jgi:hypothetical protein
MITAIKGRSADQNQTRGEEAQALHCMGKEQRDYCYHATAVDGTKGRGRVTSPHSVGPAAVNSAASDPLSPLLVLAGSLA